MKGQSGNQCFKCGKIGHWANKCRARPIGELLRSSISSIIIPSVQLDYDTNYYLKKALIVLHVEF